MANFEQQIAASDRPAPVRPVPQIVSDQLSWYDKQAGYHRLGFLALKATQILLSAAIPILALVQPKGEAWINGTIGSLVLVIEGFQQLFQFQQNWTRYRSTSEGLRRERYLYVAGAGPYAGASDSAVLLVERMDSLIAAENKSWSSLQEQGAKAKTI